MLRSWQTGLSAKHPDRRGIMTLTYVEIGGFILFGGLLGFAAGYLFGLRKGYRSGFAEGEDHALPPRDPKGRFQKS